jgi:hypothetical protein
MTRPYDPDDRNEHTTMAAGPDATGVDPAAAGLRTTAARRNRRVTVGLVVAVVLVVAVHLGLGTMLASAPWAGWAAGTIAVVVVVKLVGVGLVARSATRHRGFGPGGHLRRLGFGRRRPPDAPDGPVTRSTARVATPKAERYAKQLCDHAAWKARRAEWTPPAGVIEFPDDMGTCRVTAEPGRLVLTVEAADPGNLARMEQIVGANIERFARRDGLTVAWTQG